jgi:hypothetical protein
MANPNPDSVIMSAIATIAPAGTRLASFGNPVIIENEYLLSQGRFPALHIEADRQKYVPCGASVYDGTAKFLITYLDRWDQATVSIDVIRKNVKSDLEIIMANLMHNSSLAVAGEATAVSISQYQLSPYRGELDSTTVQGMVLLKRTLTVTVNVLPFDV